MKINSPGWFKTALHRLQCVFLLFYGNTRATALIRGGRLLIFPLHVRRLIEGGACSSKYVMYESNPRMPIPPGQPPGI